MKAALNPLVEAISAPPVPAVQAWGRAYDGRKGPLIDLSQAVPGYPPHADMLSWLSEAARDPAAALYGAIEGEPSLREAYAAHVSALYGAGIDAANVHITAGCNQAFIAAVMAVAKAGDRVLLTNPFYFNHDTSLAMMGIETRLVEARAEDGLVPTPQVVADAIATHGVKALALVSPNNPTGAIYPADVLAEILALCRKAGVWLILDETYRDFLGEAGQRPHDLFSGADWQDTLIGLYSFSKSYCIPGHRVGAVTAGESVIEAIAKVMDNLQICAPRVPQIALAKAIPALSDWRAANTAEIARRAVALREAFEGLEGFSIEAMGAYFAYVRHPYTDRQSTQVSEHLAREGGIVTIPGDFFGPGQAQFLRFAFANVDATTIATLRGRLERLLR